MWRNVTFVKASEKLGYGDINERINNFWVGPRELGVV